MVSTSSGELTEPVEDAPVEQAPTEPETSDSVAADQNATGSAPPKAQPVQAKKRGQRKSFTSARRELSEKEYSSPAVLKLVLDDLDRLEDDKTELANFRDEFHRVDKSLAVLNEKIKSNLAQEVLSLGCITVGAAAIGYAPNVWAAGGVTPFLFLSFGVLLVGSGIGAKAVKL